MQYLVLEPVVYIQLPYIYDSKFNNIFIDSFLFSITGKSWRLLTLKGSNCQSFLFLFYQKNFFFRPSILFQRTTLSRVTVKFLQLMSTSTFFWHYFFKFLFLFNFFTTSSVLVSSRNFQFFSSFLHYSSASVFCNFIFRWYVHCQHHVICRRNSWLVITRFVMIQLSIDFLTKENDVPWQIPLISEILIQCRSPPPEQCWTSAVMLDREAHFGKG